MLIIFAFLNGIKVPEPNKALNKAHFLLLMTLKFALHLQYR